MSVLELIATVKGRTGDRPLSDHLWLDLTEGGRAELIGVLAWDGEILVGYCQASRVGSSSSMEVVLHDPAEEATTGACLVAHAMRSVAEAGGGEINWWVFDPTPASDDIAHDNGLTEARTLFQMRVSLPIPAGGAAPAETRAFDPARDELAWIDVNNAAFAGHPEQGSWDLATLRQREAQSWFDPDGFRLHERDGRLAAFCWTKVHADVTPVLGEIYVIAVHPDFHGLGLGKALTLAGLDHLARRGIRTGMLYVDRDNVAAVRLYRGLGFTTHRTDRAYVGHVPAGVAIPTTEENLP